MDKTIIRPSTGDHTVIRPQPGKRSLTGSAVPQVIPDDNFIKTTDNNVFNNATNINPEISSDYFGNNINPLISSASTLIGVFSRLRNSLHHNDVAGLFNRLVNEIKLFERHAKEQMIRPETILATRYILCSTIDEAVLNTPWGGAGSWSQKTLLSTFHNETSGGEKFFLLLDRMKQAPAENIEIIELMYVLLSLGFEGKYKVINNGREQIESIRDDLFSLIRNFRGEPERFLSAGWAGREKNNSTLTEYIPMWVVASVFSLILIVSYSGFRLWLHNSSEFLSEKIQNYQTILTESKVSVTDGIKPDLLKRTDDLFKSRVDNQ